MLCVPSTLWFWRPVNRRTDGLRAWNRRSVSRMSWSVRHSSSCDGGVSALTQERETAGSRRASSSRPEFLRVAGLVWLTLTHYFFPTGRQNCCVCPIGCGSGDPTLDGWRVGLSTNGSDHYFNQNFNQY